jgi:hypothetical protein
MSRLKITYILNLAMYDVVKCYKSTVVHNYTRVEKHDKNSKTNLNMHTATQ